MKRDDKQPETSPHSQELFHLMVENIKDYAVFMTDADGRVVSWNPGIGRVLGFEENEIVGQSIAVIFNDEDTAAGAHLKEMEAAARTGCSEDKRWHRRKDGSLFWANGMVMPLKRDDGTLRGFAKVMRDDTAHKQAEEKLEQSNRRLNNILSSVSDSFYTFDREFRYLYVNEATTKMFDLPEADFLGKTLWELFPDVEGNDFHREVRRALDEQTNVVFENYYPPLDRWFENRVYPSPDGLSVFTAEITERKRAEALLRESEERYRTLFDSIDEGFCTIQMLFDENDKAFDYRFLEINPAFEKLTGIPAIEARSGKTIREMVPNFEEKWFEIYGRVALTGNAVRFVEGSEAMNRWFDVYAFRVGAADNRRVALLFNNITARRQTEENLEYQKTLLEALTESVLDGIVILSNDGRLLHFNQHFLDIWNFPAEVIAAGSDERALQWAASQTLNPAEFLARVNTVYEQPDTKVREELPMKDGRVYERFGAPIMSGDRRLGWVWTFRNITARKQAETEREKLLASERESRRQAEQANRLKDEFLATLSHELRTPLNAILGWSQVLQTQNLGESETAKALTTIERNARAQSRLIDDILDVSRIVTGKLRLDVRAVDLSDVITAAADAARPAAEAKNIRLQMLLDPQAGFISGDPNRLQQIVWNLLSNAVKFTPKGGRVQIRLERVNSHVEIVLSDTGKGIEPEFLPFVFDRFRQSDGSMTRRHGGLGLGLAIVRQLVELHGGTVSVESDGAGQGATFRVNLPLLPVRREPDSVVPRVHPRAETGAGLNCLPELSGLRVLLVDDEADSRELLELVLNSCGASVAVAASAAEAFELIQTRRFDVLVSDIGMPDEDGFSLIGKIRKLPKEKGGNVPAAALTAYARAEDRVHALRAGFQMHVAKPVEPTELVAIVANLAERERNPNS